MKKKLLSFVVSLSAATIVCAQAQKQTTVCQEIVSKYGKENPQSEMLCSKVKTYEKEHNVRIITTEQFQKIAKEITNLESLLETEKEQKKRVIIQEKITYAKRHEIPFVALEKQFLNKN